MKKFYPVSILVFLGLVVVAIVFTGSGVGVFVSLPSFVIVVGLPLVLLFATHSPADFGQAFRAAGKATQASELRVAVGFFTAMQRYLLWSGFLATMVGVIAMLAVLGDKATIGFGAALALTTVFYAIALNLLIALPFRHAAEKRLAELG